MDWLVYLSTKGKLFCWVAEESLPWLPVYTNTLELVFEWVIRLHVQNIDIYIHYNLTQKQIYIIIKGHKTLLYSVHSRKEYFTFGGGGGGGGGYTVGADIRSSADWYHHSII